MKKEKLLVFIGVYFLALMALCEVFAIIWSPLFFIGVVTYAICAFLAFCGYSEKLNKEAEDWLKT